MTHEAAQRPSSRGRAVAARLLGLLGLALLLAAPVVEVAWAEPPAEFLEHRATALLVGAGCLLLAFVLLTSGGKKRAFLAVVVLALCTVGGELVLRETIGPRYAPQYRMHDVRLHEYVPGSRRIHLPPGDETAEGVAFDVNDEGFRGPPLRAQGGAKRVLVYGDSFVAAAATPLEETYVARLGRELTEGLGTDVETVNAGVTGYGPDQVLLRMEGDLPRLRPDLVVVVLPAEDDYGDVVRNRIFDLDEGGELRRRRPEVAPELRRAFEAPPRRPVLVELAEAEVERLRRTLHGPVAAEPDESVDERLERARTEHRRAVVEGDRVVRGVFEDPTDEDLRLEPESASAEYKVRLMTRLLGAVRDVAKDHRVPILFVVVPAACDVCGDSDADARRHPAYRRENLSAPFQRIADGFGVPFLNLFVPFRGAGADGLYFRGVDTHWNSAGQALAAKLTARFVEARSLVR